MVLRTDLVNADTALDLHPAQHNEAATAILELQSAHGTSALVLQDIYDNGGSSADSVIALDATREGLEIQDTATPLSGGVLVLSGNAGSPIYLQVLSTGITANVPATFTDELRSPGSGADSAKLGVSADASGADSVAIGNTASASTTGATAVGKGADASGSGATAYGEDAAASNSSSVALGRDATASGSGSLAAGTAATASGSTSTALGNGADATGDKTVAVGVTADAAGDNSVAVGQFAQAPGDDSVAMGRTATAGSASQHNAVAIGYLANADNEAVAVGQGSVAADGGTTVGQGAACFGNTDGVAIGLLAASTGDQGVAVGTDTVASAADTVALGHAASASHARAAAIGQGAASTKTDQVVLGVSTDEVTIPGDLVGAKTATFAGTVIAGTLGGTGASLVAEGSGAMIGINAPTFPFIYIHNTDETDVEAGRLSAIGFQGETTTGTVHNLAYILAAHSGTGTDHKGRLSVHVNGGADGLSPQEVAAFRDDGDLEIVGGLEAQGEVAFGMGGSDGHVITDASEVTTSGARTVSFPDSDLHLGDHVVVVSSTARNINGSVTDGAILGGDGDYVVWMKASKTGTVLGLSASASGAVASGGTGEVKLFKNGSATGQSVTLNDSTQRVVGDVTGVTVQRGDYLGLYITTNGSWTTLNVRASLALRMRVE